jgi:hypothetical protein
VQVVAIHKLYCDFVHNIDSYKTMCKFKLRSVLQSFTIHLLEKNVFGLKYALYDSISVFLCALFRMQLLSIQFLNRINCIPRFISITSNFFCFQDHTRTVVTKIFCDLECMYLLSVILFQQTTLLPLVKSYIFIIGIYPLFFLFVFLCRSHLGTSATTCGAISSTC